MKLDALCLCRGTKKVFLRLKVSDAPEGASMSLRATTAAGENVPCSLQPFRGHADEYVATVADVDLGDITLTVNASVAGAQDSSAAFRYGPSRAKWLSRMNYRLHARECAEIRDYDKELLSAEVLLVIYDECKKEDILRCAVTSPYAEDEVTLEVLGADLGTLGSTTMPMGTKMRSSKRDTYARQTETVFSTRLKRPTDGLYLVLKSRKHPELNCFVTVFQDHYQHVADQTQAGMMPSSHDPYYPEWFDNHRATSAVVARQRATKLAAQPKLSLVVPVYRTDVALFTQMVESVLGQSYENWQLILVNASRYCVELTDRIRHFAEQDDRITVVTLEENLGIAENTNAGIAVAEGDFVGFLDHDDLIEPDLLFEYASAINNRDITDVIYCDEDHISSEGEYRYPYFKSGYNLDLLRFNNYICHLLMIRRSLLDELELSTREYDGAQDHNLVLQAVEKARYVHHVDRVLYHWRETEGSTASDTEAKPEANTAGLRAVRDHFERLGIKARVERGAYSFSYRVTYDVPEGDPLVSIVIPSKDHVDVLRTCLESIYKLTTYPHFEIVVVDNGSVEERTLRYYEQVASEHEGLFRVVRHEMPFNFSKMINIGVASASGEYLLLLNNDTELITPNWLEQLVGICARPDVGAAGVRLFFRDNTIQHAGAYFAEEIAGHYGVFLPRGTWGNYNLCDCPQDVSVVTGACMMTTRECFERVGGFDEELMVEWNDVDYCLKLRDAGLLVYYTPFVELYHYESLSRGTYDSTEKELARARREKARLNIKWADMFSRRDPYVNHSLPDIPMKVMYRSL